MRKALREFLEGKETRKGRVGGIGIESSRKVEGRDRRASVRSAHSLRHTFIYLAGWFGIPLPLVQSLIGHMTPEMTKMYMDHATDEAKRDAMERMPNLLTGGRPMAVPPEPAGRPRLVDEIRAKLTDATLGDLVALRDDIAALLRSRGRS